MDRPVQTALGTARARFVEGMSRRSSELLVVAAKVAAAPDDVPAREDIRRRLHTLFATAQVFQADALALAVKTVLVRLDAARAANRNLDAHEMAALRELAEQLPTYVGGDAEDASAPAAPNAADAAPVAVERSVAGTLAAPALVSVLVVHEPAVQSRIRALLPRDRFDVSFASDAEQAIALVHGAAPDVAFVSGELASLPEVDLVRRLQSDPLSQVRGVYVVLPEGATYDTEFLRQTGADAILVLPLHADALAALIEARVSGAPHAPARGPHTLATLSQGTVAEIAATLAEEIRFGIAESLRAGRNEEIRIDAPNELMAVAWSAIGKVRAQLAEHSRGRVRFRDDAPLEAPTFLSFGPKAPAPVWVDAESTAILSGHRVLVADDDPAVLWFFAGLLRESGARVLEATDGEAALELARRKHPDVIVIDILMPKIDGLSLCRELKRDALLAHVPVILLSWKDDFLQRMRELGSGATGYLRKEAGGPQILAAVAQALAPHKLLCDRLRAGGLAQGRVEGLGVVALLETVARERPDACVAVRDAWNLFEVDLRDGKALQVTRTAADGSFSRGEAALTQLVGVVSGRFSVSGSAAPLRAPLERPLGEALAFALHKLAALLDAVSDKRLLHVSLVSFDDEVLASLLDSTPTRMAEVVACFRSGDSSAHRLLLEGTFTPIELEECFRELARRGAITGVWDGDGVDLVAVARGEREQHPGSLRYSSPPRAPRAAPAQEMDGERELAEEHSTERVESRAQLEAALERVSSSPPPEITFVQQGDLPAVAATPRASRFQRRLSLALRVVAFVALGYLGGRYVERRIARAPTPAKAVAPIQVRAPEAPALRPQVNGSPSMPAAAPVPVPDDPFGRVVPFIERHRGVEVAPDQGLLVIEYDGQDPPELRVAERSYGRVPFAVALGAGRHEIVLRRGADTSFRYLIVRRGETRIITLPADVR